MRNKLLFGMLLMATLVSGCKVEVNEYDPEILYYRYDPKSLLAEVRITKGDEIYSYVKALLDEHRKGWHYSIVHYVPHVKVMAHNDMYRLNICPDKLVLMYWDEEKKHTTQVVKKVSNKPYNEIVALVENALQDAEDGGNSGSSGS